MFVSRWLLSTLIRCPRSPAADASLNPSSLEGSGGDDGGASLAQQEKAQSAAQQQQAQAQQQQQEEPQLEQPQELSDTDSSDWVLPKTVAGSAGGGGAAQQQQAQQAGTAGQQQQPGGGGGAEPPELFSSATVYAVRWGGGRGQLLGIGWGGLLDGHWGSCPTTGSSRRALARPGKLRCRPPRPTLTRPLPCLRVAPPQVRNGNGNFTKFYYKFRNVRLTRKGLYFYMPPGGSGAPRRGGPGPVLGHVGPCAGGELGPGLPALPAGERRGRGEQGGRDGVEACLRPVTLLPLLPPLPASLPARHAA